MLAGYLVSLNKPRVEPLPLKCPTQPRNRNTRAVRKMLNQQSSQITSIKYYGQPSLVQYTKTEKHRTHSTQKGKWPIQYKATAKHTHMDTHMHARAGTHTHTVNALYIYLTFFCVDVCTNGVY